MNDDDFEQVLSRFDRREKTTGGQISESTVKLYRSKAQDYRNWLDNPIEDTDFIDVEDYYAHLDEQYQSDSAVGKAKGALAALYDIANDLADVGRIDVDPWGRETPADRASYSPETSDTIKQRESRQDLHYLKPEQVEEMVETTERFRNKLIIRLLFQTGLRVSELCNVRMEDIDQEERAINVRGKGRKNRTVLYQPSARLWIWLEERRPAVYYAEESDYLFPTSHSPRIRREAVARIVREAAEQAGFQEVYAKNSKGTELHSVTPHVLRHSFAMEALDNGWDVHTLSKALGHEDAEVTTSTYLHEDEDRLRRAFRNRGPDIEA